MGGGGRGLAPADGQKITPVLRAFIRAAEESALPLQHLRQGVRHREQPEDTHRQGTPVYLLSQSFMLLVFFENNSVDTLRAQERRYHWNSIVFFCWIISLARLVFLSQYDIVGGLWTVQFAKCIQTVLGALLLYGTVLYFFFKHSSHSTVHVSVLCPSFFFSWLFQCCRRFWQKKTPLFVSPSIYIH